MPTNHLLKDKIGNSPLCSFWGMFRKEGFTDGTLQLSESFGAYKAVLIQWHYGHCLDSWISFFSLYWVEIFSVLLQKLSWLHETDIFGESLRETNHMRFSAWRSLSLFWRYILYLMSHVHGIYPFMLYVIACSFSLLFSDRLCEISVGSRSAHLYPLIQNFTLHIVRSWWVFVEWMSECVNCFSFVPTIEQLYPDMQGFQENIAERSFFSFVNSK